MTSSAVAQIVPDDAGRSGRRIRALIALSRRWTRYLVVAAVGLASLPAAAGAHGDEHSDPFGPAIGEGLFRQGLLPGSTGLDAPLGASAATAPSDADGDGDSPPLRVYVVVVDGLLPQQIGAQTPTLDDLKRTGTVYNQARSVLPAETLPNHAAMMTGVAPQRNGIVGNQIFAGGLPKEYMQFPGFWEADTLTTRLERAFKGEIATATILSKEYLYGLFRGEWPGPGDRSAQRQADFHWDPRSQMAYVPEPSNHGLDAGTMDALLGWLEAQKGSARPQFAFVNLGDVDRAGHADVEGVATAAADRADGGDELSGKHISAFQQGAIESADTQLGRFVKHLKDTGAWDESVLIVLSDHGMDWGPYSQVMDTTGSLSGYIGSPDGGKTGEYHVVFGGGSELVYVHNDRDIDDMARKLCVADGVAVIATRRPVAELDRKCQWRSMPELGIDHPLAGDIQVFAEPGWRSGDDNPLPGNHGHAVTQHSTLLVSGGHPDLAPPRSVDGPSVYTPGDVAVPKGPGVLSVAPTVAALFDIGAPTSGYDAPPLTEAFDPDAISLHPEPAPAHARTGAEPEGGDADTEGPLLSVGSRFVRATMTEATYTLYAANRGNATADSVIVTSDVPANASFVESDAQPTDPGVCTRNAPARTRCRWAVGAIAPGEAARVTVTYALAAATNTYTLFSTVSAQRDGNEPHETDPVFSNNLLSRSVVTPSDDTYVDDAAPAQRNWGACATLQVGGSRRAFVEDDVNMFTAELGNNASNRLDTLWGLQLRMTPTVLASPGGQPLRVAAHPIQREWSQGGGDCTGSELIPSLAEVTNPEKARSPRPGKTPPSLASPAASVEIQGPGNAVTWDLTQAFDTRRTRANFNGVELRPVGAQPGQEVTFASREAPIATRPTFVVVASRRAASRCVELSPEATARDSDQVQRFRAYVTDGGGRTTVEGHEVCNGTPVEGAVVGWELDDDAPDAYFSSAAGEELPREEDDEGGAGSDRTATVTGPNGRTFVDLRLGNAYPGELTDRTTRVAAIAMIGQVMGDNSAKPMSRMGTCEPEEQPAAFQPGCQAGNTGEGPGEDDGVTIWNGLDPVDTDGDGRVDGEDNCVDVANPDQADADGDGTGDACDTQDNRDDDGDSVQNHADNCAGVANPDQADADGDGIGDACETPTTGDSEQVGATRPTQEDFSGPTVESTDPKLRIAAVRRLRVYGGRRLRVRTRCVSDSRACVGRLTVRHRGRVIAKRRYRVPARTRRTLTVVLNKRGQRLLRRKRALRAVIVARSSTVNARRKVLLLRVAPRRS